MLFQICLAIFATELFVSGLLFILGPIFLDVEYDLNSSLAVIGIYILVVVKLLADFWIAINMISTMLVRFHYFSYMLVSVAAILAVINILLLGFQDSISIDVYYLLDSMKVDSIKTLVLIVFYIISMRVFPVVKAED